MPCRACWIRLRAFPGVMSSTTDISVYGNASRKRSSNASRSRTGRVCTARSSAAASCVSCSALSGVGVAAVGAMDREGPSSSGGNATLRAFARRTSTQTLYRIRRTHGRNRRTTFGLAC